MKVPHRGNGQKDTRLLKDKLTAAMLRSLERIIPGIGDHVLF